MIYPYLDDLVYNVDFAPGIFNVPVGVCSEGTEMVEM